MGRLDDKVCLITDGVQPLGRATARRFVRDGATVVVADADKEAGSRLVDELSAVGGRGLFIHTDAGDRSALVKTVQQAQETYGTIDALVTGSLQLSPNVRLQSKSDEMFTSTVNAVFYPVVWAMQAVFPVMRAQGGGRIVNYCAPVFGVKHWYAADFDVASTSIIGLTNTGASEWAKYRVLCNVVALPESVVLPAAGSDLASVACDGGVRRQADLEDDIAPVALFLASDDNAYITGSVITVDGGASLATTSVLKETSQAQIAEWTVGSHSRNPHRI